MNYKVTFSAKEDDVEHTLVMNRTNELFEVTINNNEVKKPEKISEMKSFLENVGNAIIERYGDNEVISALLRAFVEANVYLHYAIEEDRSKDRCANFLCDMFNNYCYDAPVVEWNHYTGRIMYFLSQKHNDNKQDIITLYNMRFLHKIKIEVEGKCLENYYVPFSTPNGNNIQPVSTKTLWMEIVMAVRNLVQKKRN